MDGSAYSYVLLVAVLGMATVFLFLWFLSGLMTLMRRAFRGDAPGPSGSAVQSLKVASTNSDSTPAWISAAVVAFLAAEDAEEIRDPVPWTVNREQRRPAWALHLPGEIRET